MTVPLQSGSNAITIRVTDAQNATLSRTVTANLTAATDTVAPLVKNHEPGRHQRADLRGQHQAGGHGQRQHRGGERHMDHLHGQIGDGHGHHKLDRRRALFIGTNSIVVRARDLAGNTGWRSVTVTRR